MGVWLSNPSEVCESEENFALYPLRHYVEVAMEIWGTWAAFNGCGSCIHTVRAVSAFLVQV